MLSDEDLRKLLQHLERPWAGYRKVRKGVKKRVRRHMGQIGCHEIVDYLHQLDRRPEFRASCEACLYVTISRFFRDHRLWQVMEDRLFPQLFRNFPAPWRIWSAGCACGQEAYTIAMVCRQIQLPPGQDLSILATDAQSTCLERAKTGRFERSSLKEVPDFLRPLYFSSKSGGRRHTVRQEKLPPIKWQRHDLITTAPPTGPFHMIFLRNNLLTYHQGLELHTALERIVSTLVPGGWLVVGSHESIPSLPRRFARDEHCPWVYQADSGTGSIHGSG